MTISTLINSLAWGSSAQPRLRASLIKDQYAFAVYFYSTKGDMELFTVFMSGWYRSSRDMYRQRSKEQNENICKRRTVSWCTSNCSQRHTCYVCSNNLGSRICRSELDPEHTNPLGSNNVQPVFLSSCLASWHLSVQHLLPIHLCTEQSKWGPPVIVEIKAQATRSIGLCPCL